MVAFMKTGLPDFRFVSAACVDLVRVATLKELPGFLTVGAAAIPSRSLYVVLWG